MIYNNRNYPYPVLGINDDFINSRISVELKVSTSNQLIEITPMFFIDNKEISELVRNDKASYVSHIYCRGTMYREVFKTQKSLSEPILIPATKLNGEVEVDFFICASDNLHNYISNSFNPEYNHTKFEVDKADIMAYAGKGKFYANKTPEELKAISALMNIDCSGKNKEPMYLDYAGEKVTLMLSVEDYSNYKLLKGNKQFFGVLLSSLVLPALIEVLHFLDDETSIDYQDNAWYKALKEIKDKSVSPEPLRIAQNILDNPLNKCFELLSIDEGYE